MAPALRHSRLLATRSTIHSIATQIDRLAPIPQSGTPTACPADTGETVLVLAAYRSGHHASVSVQLTGCLVLTNGHRARDAWALGHPSVLDHLRHLTSPTSRLAAEVIGTVALRRCDRYVIRYRLTRRARVRIDVRTSSGRLVGRFRRTGRAGRNELAWSGRRRHAHTTIPAGRYTVSIVARVGKRTAKASRRLTFRAS